MAAAAWSDAFSVTVHDVDGVPVLTLRGEVDLAAAPQVRATLGDLAAAGPPRILVDAHAVTFLDSSGLGALLSVRESASQVWLHRPSHAVRRVVEVTGTGVLLPETDTLH